MHEQMGHPVHNLLVVNPIEKVRFYDTVVFC